MTTRTPPIPSIVCKNKIIERWGTQEDFYLERKRFLDQHQKIGCVIEYDEELQMPIRAVYTFPPLLVAHEFYSLLKKIEDEALAQIEEEEK